MGLWGFGNVQRPPPDSHRSHTTSHLSSKTSARPSAQCVGCPSSAVQSKATGRHPGNRRSGRLAQPRAMAALRVPGAAYTYLAWTPTSTHTDATIHCDPIGHQMGWQEPTVYVQAWTAQDNQNTQIPGRNAA